jgi:hypothetical protein
MCVFGDTAAADHGKNMLFHLNASFLMPGWGVF